jgi:hypothetical protein
MLESHHCTPQQPNRKRIMNTTAIAAALIAHHGWVIGYSGAAAEFRTSAGVASFGHDGTVVLFGRRHETGYPLADLELGAVDLSALPAVAAAQAAALVA